MIKASELKKKPRMYKSTVAVVFVQILLKEMGQQCFYFKKDVFEHLVSHQG